MPKLELLKEVYDQSLQHDEAPTQCEGCPNLEVTTNVLGRRALKCGLFTKLLHGVARYERSGGRRTNAIQKWITVGDVYDLANSDLQPFQDETADAERLAELEMQERENPEGNLRIRISDPQESISVSYGQDRPQRVKLSEHMMKVHKVENYEGNDVSLPSTALQATLYPTVLVESVIGAPSDCPVIGEVMGQLADPRANRDKEIFFDDPIKHLA